MNIEQQIDAMLQRHIDRVTDDIRNELENYVDSSFYELQSTMVTGTTGFNDNEERFNEINARIDVVSHEVLLKACAFAEERTRDSYVNHLIEKRLLKFEDDHNFLSKTWLGDYVDARINEKFSKIFKEISQTI